MALETCKGCPGGGARGGTGAPLESWAAALRVAAAGGAGKGEAGGIFAADEEEEEEGEQVGGEQGGGQDGGGDGVVGCVGRTAGWDDIDVELFSAGPGLL